MRIALFLLRHLLFVGGIVVAIAAGAKLSPIGVDRLTSDQPVASGPLFARETWPDTWPWFLFGVSSTVAGVVLWRTELATERRQRMEFLSSHTAADDSHTDVVRLMPQLVAQVEQLGQDAEQLDERQIKARVDSIISDYLLRIVDHRNDVLHRFGMRRGSEILIALAYGERMLNRAWSAAADGYVDEARACLPQALDGFHDMQRRMESGV